MLELTSLELLAIDEVDVGKVVDGWTDSIDVVTGLNCLLYTSPSPRDRG